MRKLLLTILFIIATSHAADFGDISIERLPRLHDSYVPYGYLSNTYRLQNKGVKPATVAIREYVTYSYSHNYMRSRSMALAPMTTAYLSLYSPQFRDSPTVGFTHRYFRDGNCEIFINGTRQVLPPELLHLEGTTSHADKSVLCLVSPSLPLNEYRTLLGFTHGNDFLTGAVTPVEQWPTHVREYAGFSSVWLSSADRIKPEVSQALEDFVHLGGTLITIVPPEAPWPLADVPEPAKYDIRKVGFGRIAMLRPITRQNKTALQSIIQKLNAADSSTQNIIFNDQERHRYPALASLQSLAILPSEIKGVSIPESTLKIPPHTIPLFMLFLVMVVFAVIIGPLNYWYLQRKGKQLLLIFTTPAISIVFCLFVFLFITFYEGWRSHGAACGFTILDQTKHRADTFAHIIMDAAIRPSGGFAFSADDLVSFEGEGKIEVMDAPGQTIASSVMKPRVPLNYTVSRTEPHREQLDIVFNGDQATVTNGLGAEVRSLVILSHENIIFHHYQPIPPGGTVTLNGSDWSHSTPEARTLPQIASTLIEETEWNASYTTPWLQKGQYVARVNEPLFYSIGMKPDVLNATHFIFGRF